MSDSKILLTYNDYEGNYQVESLWATKHGDFYEIDNIPFFAPNIALGDLIDVEEDTGQLYFNRLIKPSGHSTIQVIFFDESYVNQFGKDIEELGCTWEGSHLKNLLSVDVPKDVNYTIVKNYLDKGEKEMHWSYKEACLAHTL